MLLGTAGHSCHNLDSAKSAAVCSTERLPSALKQHEEGSDLRMPDYSARPAPSISSTLQRLIWTPRKCRDSSLPAALVSSTGKFRPPPLSTAKGDSTLRFLASEQQGPAIEGNRVACQKVLQQFALVPLTHSILKRSPWLVETKVFDRCFRCFFFCSRDSADAVS